jgi:hypothetical protein
MRRWAAAFPWWLLFPLLLGVALRVFRLRQQVLEGDELHTVRAAVAVPFAEILRGYRQADVCLPLTALDRALMLAGCRLSEMGFRLPSLLAGAAALVLLPLLAARRLGRGTAALYACLLAISPLLVIYSRNVRPYMPMTLAALLAAAAFWAWWRGAGRGFAAAYVAAAALAIWLHLAAAPFVAAPFLCAAVELARPAAAPERARRLRQLAVLGLALLAACGAFLLPARQSLTENVAAKRIAQLVPRQTWAGVSMLQAGTARPVVAVAFWTLAMAGLVRLLAACPGLGAWTLGLAAAQLLGIRLLSPLGLADPVILDRYLLPVLPLALLWVAVALAFPWRRSSSVAGSGGRRGVTARWALRVGSAGFVLALAAAGPLADPARWRTSFMDNYDFIAFFTPRPAVAADDAPAFYADLAAARDRRAIVEYPWHPLLELRSFYLYQEIHRRRVIVSGAQKQFAAPGLALRNFVPPEPAALCATGARFLVVHPHIAREEDWLGDSGLDREMRRALRGQGVELADRLASRWGPPAWADRDLRVWDLDRACGRIAASPPAAR